MTYGSTIVNSADVYEYEPLYGRQSAIGNWQSVVDSPRWDILGAGSGAGMPQLVSHQLAMPVIYDSCSSWLKLVVLMLLLFVRPRCFLRSVSEYFCKLKQSFALSLQWKERRRKKQRRISIKWNSLQSTHIIHIYICIYIFADFNTINMCICVQKLLQSICFCHKVRGSQRNTEHREQKSNDGLSSAGSWLWC